jgi:hypothetical protein
MGAKHSEKIRTLGKRKGAAPKGRLDCSPKGR